MENNIKKALDNFIEDPLVKNEETEPDKKVTLKEREGLIERVDRIYVTNDGRQLLREQY